MDAKITRASKLHDLQFDDGGDDFGLSAPATAWLYGAHNIGQTSHDMILNYYRVGIVRTLPLRRINYCKLDMLEIFKDCRNV